MQEDSLLTHGRNLFFEYGSTSWNSVVFFILIRELVCFPVSVSLKWVSSCDCTGSQIPRFAEQAGRPEGQGRVHSGVQDQRQTHLRIPSSSGEIQF